MLKNLNINDQNNDQSYLTLSDFRQTLKSMSKQCFILDLNFLALLIKNTKKKDMDEMVNI